jgi:hypothetical protein
MTDVCPGDAGGCTPSATDTGCSCSGSTLTCNEMFTVDAGTVTEVLTLDFSMADWSGTETLTLGGETCTYTITTTM